MAKINVYVPEPPKEYTEEGFRQINQALATVENQLNTSYQQDLKTNKIRLITLCNDNKI